MTARETTCHCGERIRLVSPKEDIWEHVTGGDPADPFYCYEDEDHLDPERRCTAGPE